MNDLYIDDPNHNQSIKTQLSIIIIVGLTKEFRNVDFFLNPSIILSAYSLNFYCNLKYKSHFSKKEKKLDNSIIIGIILAWCNIRKKGRKKYFQC